MSDLLTASRSVRSWKCEPMTVDQIDAHPDRDRIWATIATIQSAYGKGIEDAEMGVEDEIQSAEDHAYSEARKSIRVAVDAIIKAENIPEALAAKIRKLKDAI